MKSLHSIAPDEPDTRKLVNFVTRNCGGARKDALTFPLIRSLLSRGVLAVHRLIDVAFLAEQMDNLRSRRGRALSGIM